MEIRVNTSVIIRSPKKDARLVNKAKKEVIRALEDSGYEVNYSTAFEPKEPAIRM